MEHPPCRDLLESLSAYIGEEASQEMCDEIERHLADCPDCSILVNTLRKTIYLYRHDQPGEALPDDVRGRLYRALHLDDFIDRHASKAPDGNAQVP
jgi:anti-sigma factor RsiW